MWQFRTGLDEVGQGVSGLAGGIVTRYSMLVTLRKSTMGDRY